MDIGRDLQDAYECGRQDALNELMDYTYGMLTTEKFGLQHKIKSMMADRKTENSSEKPNNCKYAENPSGDVWECGCFLDTYCEHQIYDRNPDGTINIVECGYEPKDEPQTDFMRGFLQGLHDAVAEIVDEPQTESE